MLQFDEELSQRLGLSLNSQTYSIDSNNNSDTDNNKMKNRGEKYSLRPRSMRRTKKDLSENVDEEITTTTVSSAKSKCQKAKQKPAPLSKYRRKTANARERSRMREINQAFEALRKAVPQILPSQQQNEKLTKITTLRLAMKYIATLSAALSGGSSEQTQDFFSDCSEIDSFLLESDGESLPLNSDFSDHSLTPSAEFSMDFDDSLTPVDFAPLSPDLMTSHLSHFDPFLADFS